MGCTPTKVVGYRKPGTALGTWNGAYVAQTHCGVPTIAALFEDGKDYIGYPGPVDYWRMVKKLTDEGWVPMTREDIFDTAGI